MVAAAVALLPANASATTTTLGQLAPGSSPQANCIGGPVDLVPGNVDEGNGYTVPAGGTITQWSTNAAAGAGQMLKMKVFRHLSGLTYLVVAQDGPHPLTPGVINTFDVSIPVRAGDVIGLNDQNADSAHNACDFHARPGDSHNDAGGDADDGAQVDTSYFVTTGARLNVTATLTLPDLAPPPYSFFSTPLPTGQRAKALHGCKKRARKHHWSRWKLKRCRKWANRLPV